MQTGTRPWDTRLIGVAAVVVLAAACASTPEAGPRVVEGGVVFRLRAPGAARVAVVGSFNGWDPDRHPLRGPGPGGVFEAFVPIDDRRIEYQFSVDGVRRPDPAAPVSVDDGFGGRNGLIVRP